MDALIRSARLAPTSRRLGVLGSRSTPDPMVGAPAQAPQALASDAPASPSTDEARWAAVRMEVDRQVRDDLEDQAQQRWEQEREEARVEGFAAGLAQAHDSLIREKDSLEAQLRSEIESGWSALAKAHDAVISQLESSVGEVAFAVVCRFLGETLCAAPALKELVEQSCRSLEGESVATARMHPADMAALARLLGAEGAAEPMRIGALQLSLVADESLVLGGCIVETSSGILDASLKTQLSRLHAILVDGRRKSSGEAA